MYIVCMSSVLWMYLDNYIRMCMCMCMYMLRITFQRLRYTDEQKGILMHHFNESPNGRVRCYYF